MFEPTATLPPPAVDDPKGWTTDQKIRHAIEMAEGDATIQEIADFFGVTRQAVDSWFSRRGVSMKTLRPKWKTRGTNEEEKQKKRLFGRYERRFGKPVPSSWTLEQVRNALKATAVKCDSCGEPLVMGRPEAPWHYCRKPECQRAFNRIRTTTRYHQVHPDAAHYTKSDGTWTTWDTRPPLYSPSTSLRSLGKQPAEQDATA